MAKDLWRIREVMKSPRDIDDKLLNIDKEKTEGLIRNHIVWNEEGRKVEKEDTSREEEDSEEGVVEGMIRKVEITLSGTQNS